MCCEEYSQGNNRACRRPRPYGPSNQGTYTPQRGNHATRRGTRRLPTNAIQRCRYVYANIPYTILSSPRQFLRPSRRRNQCRTKQLCQRSTKQNYYRQTNNLQPSRHCLKTKMRRWLYNKLCLWTITNIQPRNTQKPRYSPSYRP